MNREIYRDSLMVINGPEDGNVHSIVQSPCFVGNDDSCAVPVTLDRGIQPKHAIITPANGGYRVRCITRSAAYVDGRRASRLRSRILRPGGELKLGYTRLVLKPASGGLAERFRGVDLHGDVSFALRELVAKTRWLLIGILTLSTDLLFGIVRLWKLLLPVGVILAFFYLRPAPNLIPWIIYYIRLGLYHLGVNI